MTVTVAMKLSPKQAGKLYMKSLDQEARIKELELQIGLLQIAHDHKATLLESCEKALAERDGLAS